MDARIADVLTGVFGKRLAPTEIHHLHVSRSQAIQVGGATEMLGTQSGKTYYQCDLIRLTDDAPPLFESERLTLSNVREGKANRTPEWRLNYPGASTVMGATQAGDLCWIAGRKSDAAGLLLVVAPISSEVASRLDRLLDTGLTSQPELPVESLKAADFEQGSTTSVGANAIDGDDAWLLELLGVPVSTPNAHLLERLFGLVARKTVSAKTGFVAVEPFCAAVRSLLPGVDGRDPDGAIATWMAVTEELYFLYEETVIQKRLNDTFANQQNIDIGTFTSVASSILNTRKSRAGGAMESHLSAMFKANGIAHERITRPLRTDKTKPDFLMPSLALYYDNDFQTELLSTVASKRTLKERWMQVPTEGTRIPVKHLATMDRDVPGATILSMGQHSVIPVMPKSLRDETYASLTAHIWTFADLLTMLRDKQDGAIELEWAVTNPN